MTLRVYFNMVLKWLWLLILLPVVTAGALAYLKYRSEVPVYETKATLIVISKAQSADEMKSAYNDVSLTAQLISDYREIVRSRKFCELVVQDEKLRGMNPYSIPNKITLNFKADSRVMEVSVWDLDAQRARDIANRVCQVFVSEVKKLIRVDNIEILDKALTPMYPITSSMTRRLVIGFAIGLIVAIGIVLFLEYLDESVKTPEDIENQLGMSVLSIIPRVKRKKADGNSLAVKGNADAPEQESYRVLRSNIQFCDPEKRIKTLCITSSNPNEGKTVTALNLGTAMARSGMKVLVVDADLRKPMMLKDQGPVKPGLTSYISGAAAIDDITCRTDIDNLYTIASGPMPPSAAELISSPIFSMFVKKVREQYDMVLFDTTSCSGLIDGAIVAAQTDGTLIVVESKKVDIHTVRRVREQLVKANANIIGAVLNKLRKRDYKYYFGYHHYVKASRKAMNSLLKAGAQDKNSRSEKGFKHDRYTQPHHSWGG